MCTHISAPSPHNTKAECSGKDFQNLFIEQFNTELNIKIISKRLPVAHTHNMHSYNKRAHNKNIHRIFILFQKRAGDALNNAKSSLCASMTYGHYIRCLCHIFAIRRYQLNFPRGHAIPSRPEKGETVQYTFILCIAPLAARQKWTTAKRAK